MYSYIKFKMLCQFFYLYSRDYNINVLTLITNKQVRHLKDGVRPSGSRVQIFHTFFPFVLTSIAARFLVTFLNSKNIFWFVSEGTLWRSLFFLKFLIIWNCFHFFLIFSFFCCFIFLFFDFSKLFYFIFFFFLKIFSFFFLFCVFFFIFWFFDFFWIFYLFFIFDFFVFFLLFFLFFFFVLRFFSFF